MLLKFAHVTTFYSSYLKKLYQDNPFLKHQSYSQQQQLIFDDLFGWADFFPKNLSSLGYESIVIMNNAEILQKKWALENRFKYVKESWQEDILITQLKLFQPDILFIEDPISFPINRVKNEILGIKLVIMYICVSVSSISISQEADVVITCVEWLYQKFLDAGVNSFLVRHAFEDSILHKVEFHKNKFYDLSFVGNCFQNHSHRHRLLQLLAIETNISIWTPSTSNTFYSLVKSGFKSLLRGRFHEYLEKEVNSPIRRKNKGIVFGKQMYQVLASSKIAINVHIDDAKNQGGNMRMFEATGIGTCLVTDWKENLADFFLIDKEIVTYKSPEECIEKVRWLLEHPQEREAIAKAGQARTLKDHTFAQRATQLDQIIQRALKRSR